MAGHQIGRCQFGRGAIGMASWGRGRARGGAGGRGYRRTAEVARAAGDCEGGLKVTADRGQSGVGGGGRRGTRQATGVVQCRGSRDADLISFRTWPPGLLRPSRQGGLVWRLGPGWSGWSGPGEHAAMRVGSRVDDGSIHAAHAHTHNLCCCGPALVSLRSPAHC